MTNEPERAFMRRALRLAARAMGRTSPNPLVGAVVVRGDRVVGEGYHRAAGEPHAEIVAIDRAGADARGATLFTNLEPCAHTGRTPPCVSAIASAGIAHVVAAMRDPDPGANGKGVRALRERGIALTEGILEDEARRLNAGFISRITRGRPHVVLRVAATIDGRTPLPRHERGAKRVARELHRLRDRFDAVLVGVDRIVGADPALTVTEIRGRDPLRVVVDGDARTPSKASVVRAKDPQRTVIFVARDADRRRTKRLRAAGVLLATVPRAQDGLDLGAVLRWLGERGVNTVLVEGGPTVAGALVRERLADRLLFVLSPLAGGTGAPALDGATKAAPLRELKVRRVGEDLVLEAQLE
jgi:diaminohydroxyphosphoribosylaminopyrimidine deaminase/5-amino-6-(5-phosphoribosylamino)uracil reductase